MSHQALVLRWLLSIDDKFPPSEEERIEHSTKDFKILQGPSHQKSHLSARNGVVKSNPTKDQRQPSEKAAHDERRCKQAVNSLQTIQKIEADILMGNNQSCGETQSNRCGSKQENDQSQVQDLSRSESNTKHVDGQKTIQDNVAAATILLDGYGGLSSKEKSSYARDPLESRLEQRDTVDPAGNKFERQSRRKTRADRYELKKDEQKVTPCGPPVKKRKRTQQKSGHRTGAALLHDFNAPNVASERLTLEPRNVVGIFGNGRVSSLNQCKAPADGGCSFKSKLFDTHELSTGRTATTSRRNRMNRDAKIEAKAESEAERSRYFESRRRMEARKQDKNRSIGHDKREDAPSNNESPCHHDSRSRSLRALDSGGASHHLLAQIGNDLHPATTSPGSKTSPRQSKSCFTWSLSESTARHRSRIQSKQHQQFVANHEGRCQICATHHDSSPSQQAKGKQSCCCDGDNCVSADLLENQHTIPVSVRSHCVHTAKRRSNRVDDPVADRTSVHDAAGQLVCESCERSPLEETRMIPPKDGCVQQKQYLSAHKEALMQPTENNRLIRGDRVTAHCFEPTNRKRNMTLPCPVAPSISPLSNSADQRGPPCKSYSRHRSTRDSSRLPLSGVDEGTQLEQRQILPPDCNLGRLDLPPQTGSRQRDGSPYLLTPQLLLQSARPNILASYRTAIQTDGLWDGLETPSIYQDSDWYRSGSPDRLGPCIDNHTRSRRQSILSAKPFQPPYFWPTNSSFRKPIQIKSEDLSPYQDEAKPHKRRRPFVNDVLGELDLEPQSASDELDNDAKQLSTSEAKCATDKLNSARGRMGASLDLSHCYESLNSIVMSHGNTASSPEAYVSITAEPRPFTVVPDVPDDLVGFWTPNKLY